MTNPHEILTQGTLAQKEGWDWFWVLWPRPFSKKGPKGAKLGVFIYFDVEHLLFVRFLWGFFHCIPNKIPYLEYVNGFNVAFSVFEINGAKKGGNLKKLFF